VLRTPLLLWGTTLVILLGGSAWADRSRAFLEGGAGARALGMGGAYTAIADDASGIYWNPAGLASTDRHEVLLSHEFRFGDLLDYSFLGGIYQVRQRNGRFGLGVILLGIDNIAFTDSSLWTDTNANGEIDPGEFSYDEQRDIDKIHFENDAEYAIFMSRPARSRVFGGNIKFITQSVGDFSSFGIGVDVGVLRAMATTDVGLAVHDLTGTYLSGAPGARRPSCPCHPRLAYRLDSATLRGSFLFAGDGDALRRPARRRPVLGRCDVGEPQLGSEFNMQNRLGAALRIAGRDLQAGADLPPARCASTTSSPIPRTTSTSPSACPCATSALTPPDGPCVDTSA
jgi:hypothetical protein